jgi:hypothetical protein
VFFVNVDFVETALSVLFREELAFARILSVEQSPVSSGIRLPVSDKKFDVWFGFVRLVDKIAVVRNDNQFGIDGC